MAISTGQYPQRWSTSYRVIVITTTNGEWLSGDPKAPMLARSLEKQAMPPDILGNGIWEVSEMWPMLAHSDYGFDESLTLRGYGAETATPHPKTRTGSQWPGRIWER